MCSRRRGVTRDHSGSSPRAAATSTVERRSSPASVEATADIWFEDRTVSDRRIGYVVVAPKLHSAADPAVDDPASGADHGFRTDIGRPFQYHPRIDDRILTDPNVDIHEHGFGKEEG